MFLDFLPEPKLIASPRVEIGDVREQSPGMFHILNPEVPRSCEL